MGMKRKTPPVRRLSEDARPLSNLEMDMYRNKRVLHTPAPPPSTSNVQLATNKHSEFQRKLLESRIRNHNKSPYTAHITRPELMARTISRGVPMTPAITPTTISLTSLETPQPITTDPFVSLSSEARHLYSRSMSQPATLLRSRPATRGVSNPTHMPSDHRIMFQRLASYMAGNSNSSNGSGGSADSQPGHNLPPPNE